MSASEPSFELRRGECEAASEAGATCADQTPRETPAELPAHPGLQTAQPMDLVSILSGVDETAYTWDLRTDRLDWESNVTSVLGVRSSNLIATGAAFQFLIAAEHVSRRQMAFDAKRRQDDPNVTGLSAASGTQYRVQYRFIPLGRRSDKSLWIEDHGRWWADSDGQLTHARGVIRVINERYMEEQRLLYRSDHDELTGQLNRTRLTEALATVIARAEESGKSGVFMLASINNLSRINDMFGFEVGDAALSAVGRLVRGRLRGGDTIGRYSCNKFGIILNDCGPGSMQVAAERFMNAVRETTVQTVSCPISPTLSIGGVLIPDQAQNVPLAISRALQALEKARTRRHDAFVAFDSNGSVERVRQRNLEIADDITAALDDQRMRLLLQPVVCSKTGEPAFYECLLRMVKPDGRMVGAAEFIELAEQLGMSRLIDRRALELAVDLLKHQSDLNLSINVSGLTCAHPDWIVTLHRLTGGQSWLTRRLIVEITETTVIEDLDQTMAFVDTLRELGCRVAIDDFGAGYTSFRNLKLLNPDLVKIDGAFVRNLATDKSDRIFIKMMAELSEAFGREVVAEWVTDAQTAEIVRELGITYMQGYHFGKPIDPRELRPADSNVCHERRSQA